jgi:hypothetical protein
VPCHSCNECCCERNAVNGRDMRCVWSTIDMGKSSDPNSWPRDRRRDLRHLCLDMFTTGGSTNEMPCADRTMTQRRERTDSRIPIAEVLPYTSCRQDDHIDIERPFSLDHYKCDGSTIGFCACGWHFIALLSALTRCPKGSSRGPNVLHDPRASSQPEPWCSSRAMSTGICSPSKRASSLECQNSVLEIQICISSRGPKSIQTPTRIETF